jgi:hypothetical protein
LISFRVGESAEPDVDDPESAEPEVQESLPPLSTSEILLQRQLKLADKKETMALLASGVLEQPHDGVCKLYQQILYLSMFYRDEKFQILEDIHAKTPN